VWGRLPNRTAEQPGRLRLPIDGKLEHMQSEIIRVVARGGGGGRHVLMHVGR
jgi:hypothetical protein